MSYKLPLLQVLESDRGLTIIDRLGDPNSIPEQNSINVNIALILLYYIAPSAWAVEYTDCISAEE